MEPFILIIYGLATATSIIIHEIWTDYFGYTMCNMAVEYCEEEFMREPGIVIIRH
jgi:hypothetical protein